MKIDLTYPLHKKMWDQLLKVPVTDRVEVWLTFLRNLNRQQDHRILKANVLCVKIIVPCKPPSACAEKLTQKKCRLKRAKKSRMVQNSNNIPFWGTSYFIAYRKLWLDKFLYAWVEKGNYPFRFQGCCNGSFCCSQAAWWGIVWLLTYAACAIVCYVR